MTTRKRGKKNEPTVTTETPEQTATTETPTQEQPMENTATEQPEQTATTEEPATEQTEQTTELTTTTEQPEQTATTTPAPQKKLSGSDFVMRHLIRNPDATVAEIREALDAEGLKMADSTLTTWPPFMKKIFGFLNEAGWKKPKRKKADPAATGPAEGEASER